MASSKAWTTQDGNVRAGKLIDKSLIYKLLGNRTYLGELCIKDEWFKGEHQPLIEPSTWNAVQSVLKISPRMRGNYTRATVLFLLKGIVEGADGRALTAAWTRKGAGKLYRYYIHTRENKEHAGASGLPRFPAIELKPMSWRNCAVSCAHLISRPAAQLMIAGTCRLMKLRCVSRCCRSTRHDQLFPVEQERIVRLGDHQGGGHGPQH